MTDKEINKAIAEHLGYRVVSSLEYGLYWLETADGKNHGYRQGISEEHAWAVCCPNYCASLDALKPVIDNLRKLPGPQWYDFITAAKDHFGTLGNCIVPDPKELAMVLLRALGKYKE